MKRQHLLLAIVLVFSTIQLQAQVMGNYANQQQTYQNINVNAQYRGVPKAAAILDGNVLEISINSLFNQQAEAYTAIFTVAQTGKTAEETNDLLNTRLNGLVESLKNLGIQPSDLYIDMVNFLPKYEYDVSKKIFSKRTYTEIPKGFELQKNIHIRYTNPALLEQIVTAAAKQEIYDIVKVDYFIKDQQSVYTQLRKLTFDYLKTIETQYRTIGMQIDSAYLITAENAWVAYPINRYETYQAYTSQGLDAFEKNNSVIQSADKPVLRFYNAVPANDYDIVVNPEILEPAIQFSYNLVARFTLPERQPAVKTQVKKEFIWLTPTGEAKTIKVE
ncbi:MAG: SIMPL domain-containing protein [Saprospiraceae bacterium]|nr:SIMPL domain-containing protein [Saprospiraceae bacterium]